MSEKCSRIEHRSEARIEHGDSTGLDRYGWRGGEGWQMSDGAVVRYIRREIDQVNRRLRETDSGPSNADLALWGTLAIAQLNSSAASGEGSATDVELVLSDLLADLMHWCDLRSIAQSRQQVISFESALEKARAYYREECNSESLQTVTSRRRRPRP